MNQYVLVEQSQNLNGEVKLVGAKNAVLVIMASLILTCGKSRLKNVPNSDDVYQMISLLQSLGAKVCFNITENILDVDTTNLISCKVSPDIMKKMRASILVMGPLLARFGKAEVALPGGCLLGARPIDLHLKAFSHMGVDVNNSSDFIYVSTNKMKSVKLILEYPSVGATENIMMAAVLTPGITKIINASLEPEVIDLINILTKMGAQIKILPASTIEIEGVTELRAVEHEIMHDRLEAGSLILACAVAGGQISLPQAPAFAMEVFLLKLQEMGHSVQINDSGIGVAFKATSNPCAVSFKTMPYPGFPTDLQAPMMAALSLASGTSIVQETVFENRLLHVRELQKMGAQITVEGDTAIIKGVDSLYGANVIATDIRASCALVIAGLAAQGQTSMTGVHHLKRGYQGFIEKLNFVGAKISIINE